MCENVGQSTYVVGKWRNVLRTIASDVRAVKSSRLSELLLKLASDSTLSVILILLS
jgi:hypothetical protein